MATITNTLIQGLTAPMVQARLNSVDATPFHFGRLFPVKKQNGFTWSTLRNQVEKGNVAADLHTDNGTIIRKRRPVFDVAKGDIPFISISRELSRAEIKDYQTALAFAKDADATQLVQYWGEDVDFCFNGVNAEIEYIALQLLSQAGKLAFTTTNNATFANEFDLDYGVADEQKLTTDKAWSDKTADIIGNLQAIVKKAKQMGLNPKFAFISQNEFYNIACNEQIQKMNSTLPQIAAGAYLTPTVDEVNKLFSRMAWLNGIQLRVIDQTVTRELQDGTRTSANPFEDGRLVLTESERVGSTQYDILQENDGAILRAVRSHAVIKKYGTIEPKAEITIGQADAMPVLDSAYRNLYIKTDGTEW